MLAILGWVVFGVIIAGGLGVIWLVVDLARNYNNGADGNERYLGERRSIADHRRVREATINQVVSKQGDSN